MADDRIILKPRALTEGESHDPECACEICRINDSLGWDADITDPRQYCRHGTFIGSAGGPDYMCGRCEMGDD